jgi:hypothetical protein
LGRFRQSNPAKGKEKNKLASRALLEAGTAAVVASVKATAEGSIPAPTCTGLKLHVVSAGNLEQAKVTLLGNDPVVGLTFRLKTAGCPTGSDALAGVLPIVKSKVWLGVAVNMSGAE